MTEKWLFFTSIIKDYLRNETKKQPEGCLLFILCNVKNDEIINVPVYPAI
jgi:hypothetical protein